MVRDIKVVETMREKQTSTLREITDSVKLSKSAAWKLVEKLTEKGPVKETGQKRESRGFLGRPSTVYKFTEYAKK
ncbi:hypothetical protein AKJ56_00545 [candidate division MSBL1 archaeon SCGC-AAA382N08]|uniref:HTH marR-type domain-containing protein n=1 Tax=candidate division MSBL1 archaeon SCGC-AAA382N08 TaxID=1698285 RepID=A0A133VQF9_9EURY|nr:hypothetical protein AKJ56_00545 [candidate division MSBL1 archaeon SCGC-AAA382N08]